MSEKKSRIMIVDDEADILLVLGEYLGKEGFTVLACQSGEQAISKIKEDKVDLALVDMAMPVMDGIETLKKLKAIKSDLPVIMITAYRDAEKVVNAFRLGAFDCIFKPFDLKYLLEAVINNLRK